MTPHKYSALAAVHEELELLKEENRRLHEIVFPKNPVLYQGAGKLSRQEHLLLHTILQAKGSFCSREHAQNVLYFDRDEPECITGLFDVMLSHIRKTLGPELGNLIETINGRGWRVSSENKLKFKPVETTMAEPTRSHLPDETGEQKTDREAVDRAVDAAAKGRLTRSQAGSMKDAADKALTGHDVGRAIRNMQRLEL